jgi:hypothetical protein
MIARETLVLHAFAALLPIDASQPDAPAITTPLQLQLDLLPPADAARFPRRREVIARRHGFAFAFGEWGVVSGEVTAAAREAFAPSTRDESLADPAARAVDRASVPARGVLHDPTGRWLPRRFAFELARSAQQQVGLFPACARVIRDRAGALLARLALEDGRALPFARATLTVTIVGRAPIAIEAQSDGDGALVIPLRSLPELPSGAAPYVASLRVRAAAPAAGFDAALLARAEFAAQHAVDSDALPDALLQSAGAFAATLPLTVAPGRDERLRADGSPLLVRVA